MAPIGVRVITVILGAVETSGNDTVNVEDLELPANSYYQEIRETINRHKKHVVFTKKQNVDVAAKAIVNDVLGGRSTFIRRGEASTLSWFCNTFLPYGLFTSMINGESGLTEVGGK
jgi:1-acylglycerone phosphate reductase